MPKPKNLFVGSHKGTNELVRLNWERTFGTICNKHPGYKGLDRPRNNCDICLGFWDRYQKARVKYGVAPTK